MDNEQIVSTEEVAAPVAEQQENREPREARESRDGGRPSFRNNKRRKKVCAFCADKIDFIDYKDTLRIRKNLSERCKILPRRVTGTCARHQRQLTIAVKRARHLALIPYITD